MQIKINNFEGPLDLLLQLIEKDKLDITQISLLKVTEQYIAYLHQVKENKPEELADFLLVAAKLLYIKSKALLPELTEEDESGELDLAEQLRLYKKFIEAGEKLGEMFVSRHRAYGRPLFLSPASYSYQPPRALNSEKLAVVFSSLVNGLRAMQKLPKQTLRRVISINDKIKQILSLLGSREKLVFTDLILEKANKAEKIISFLGVLELSKQRKLAVEQNELFGEIIIKKII